MLNQLQKNQISLQCNRPCVGYRPLCEIGVFATDQPRKAFLLSHHLSGDRLKEDAKMFTQIQFKVFNPADEQLEKVTHNWLKQAVFFIGASWYTHSPKILTIEEVSKKLRLRWLNGYGTIRVAIEQRVKGNNWLGSYSIGNLDPFTLDCFLRGYQVNDEEFELVEHLVKSYLPQVEFVRCYFCRNRFDNLYVEDKWCCDSCQREFAEKPNTTGFVYVFGSAKTGFYKIGCGNAPMSRMKDYQPSKLPFSVEMIHTIPVDDKIKAEAELHRLFREKHTNGEWFRLSAEDLEKITGLKKYVAGQWVRGVTG